MRDMIRRHCTRVTVFLLWHWHSCGFRGWQQSPAVPSAGRIKTKLSETVSLARACQHRLLGLQAVSQAVCQTRIAAKPATPRAAFVDAATQTKEEDECRQAGTQTCLVQKACGCDLLLSPGDSFNDSQFLNSSKAPWGAVSNVEPPPVRPAAIMMFLPSC